MAEIFYCDPDVAQLFGENAGGCEFWLKAEIGRQLSSERAERELRFVEADGQKFFLKRNGIESICHSLPMLFCGLRPRSGVLRELLLLQCLKKSGFDVMEPAAWGEASAGFFSLRSFLLVRNVEGIDAGKYYRNATSAERRVLLEKTGELTGRVHAAGFFQAIRLKDLIYNNGQLTIIDRETYRPWKDRFKKQRCIAALERAVRRTVRDGHQFDAAGIRGFLKGYVRGVSCRWTVTPRELFRLVSVRVKKQRGIHDH